jgi:hypothetical protein
LLSVESLGDARPVFRSQVAAHRKWSSAMRLSHGSPDAASSANHPTRHQKPRPVARLLYRTGGLTADELVRLVEEVGPDRLLSAIDQYTQPQLPLVAAE